MSQDSVMEFLKDNPNEWFTAKQISERINLAHNTTLRNVGILRRDRFVELIPLPYGSFKYKYKKSED